MAPFGFMIDGLDEGSFVDAEGDRWNKADEYGDRSFMWEYTVSYTHLTLPTKA